VNVTNEGLRPASNVRVELPKNEPLLSVVSFATKQQQGADADRLRLAPGESALLVLSVMALADDALGTRDGSMVIRSLETSVALPYRYLSHTALPYRCSLPYRSSSCELFIYSIIYCIIIDLCTTTTIIDSVLYS